MSKIALTPNASGSGTFTLASPNSDTDRSLTLPDGAGTLDRLERTGNVLQVVEGTTSTQVDITTDTLTDSGFSGSITPTSTSSKILVQVSIHTRISRSGDNASANMRLLRDSTAIVTYSSQTPKVESQGTGNNFTRWAGFMAFQNLDSPSTTSQITYKVQGAMDVTSLSPQLSFNVKPSSIIVMEIAG